MKVTASLLAACLLAQAQTTRLYPFDHTDRDSAFRSYVRRLHNAVDRRDAAALRKLVDDEVAVGPAKTDQGWAKFVARWRPEERDNSPVWPALSDLLMLGFIQEHPQLFVSPYLVWRFPRELNPSRHLVIVRDKVPLRAEPTQRADVLALLSFDIVERLSGAVGSDKLVQWVRVRTLDGKEGYVESRDAMSPLMPRAQFGKPHGRWTMVALEGP